MLGGCHPDFNGGQRPGSGVQVRQPPGACEWLLWKEHLRGGPQTALGLACNNLQVTAGAVLGTERPKQSSSIPTKTKQREPLACSGEHHSVLEQKFGQSEQPDGRRQSGHRPRHAPGSSWSATTPGRRGGGGAPQSRGKHLPFWKNQKWCVWPNGQTTWRGFDGYGKRSAALLSRKKIRAAVAYREVYPSRVPP